MLGVTTRLPDPLVGVLPDARGAVRLGLDDRPELTRKALAAPRVQQHRVQGGSEDIVLALVEGAIARSHR